MYKQVKGWQKHLDFILIDLAGLQLSFIIAYWFRNGIANPYQRESYRMLAVFASAFFLIIALVDNCYSGILRRRKLRELYVVVRQNLIFLVVMLSFLFIIHNTETYSRIIITAFIATNTVMELLLHLVYKWVIQHRIRDTKHSQHIVLVLGGRNARLRVQQWSHIKYNSMVLDGAFLLGCPEQVLGDSGFICLGTTEEEVLEYARTHVVDEVMVELAESSTPLAEQLLNMGITVHMSMDREFANLPNLTIERVNDVPCMTASVHTITGAEAFIKRAVDIVGGIVGVILTGVIFLFVAPVIKLQAPGPVFFAQDRVGKNGRIFKMYKFRSMYMDAEERKAELMEQNKMSGLMFKMDNDPRIYPFGHFLRNSSLDEFPQFWNILKGDMSLVGTRPPTVDEYKQYELHHKSRLAAKPGLTGMWQVSGRSDITDFEEVVKLDQKYIQNWSLSLDLDLLIKTVKVVVRGKGAV